MTTLPNIRPIWWVGLLGGFCLISFSVGVRMVREELRVVNRLETNWRELKSLTVNSEAQLSHLTKTIEDEAPDPQSLFVNEQFKSQLDWEKPEQIELPEGFRHQKVKMLIEGLDPGALESVFTIVENAKPAWRVTRIQLETRAGSLHGSMQLEALDKSPRDL